MRDSSTVVLGGKDYEITRAKLRVWLQLEDVREQIARAADSKDRERFIASIYSYLSVALSVDIDFSTLPWYEVVDAYIEITLINKPFFDFPFLKSAGKSEKVPWDYEGRTWFHWSHLFAEAYTWTLEYIAELDVDEAIAHLQEIFTSKQMQREWEWMLSDKSISYDRRGKSTFHEYNRPDWMGGKFIPEGKKLTLDSKIRIKKSMIPMGNVIRWNDGKLDA